MRAVFAILAALPGEARRAGSLLSAVLAAIAGAAAAVTTDDHVDAEDYEERRPGNVPVHRIYAKCVHQRCDADKDEYEREEHGYVCFYTLNND
jgi:hypothetical protein